LVSIVFFPYQKVDDKSEKKKRKNKKKKKGLDSEREASFFPQN
jgi:hypothetical protein